MTEPTQRSLDMLNTALSMEEKGKAFYQKAIEQCANDLGQEIFRKLKADEDVHVARIKAIYAQLSGEGQWTDAWKEHKVELEDLGGFFRKLAKKHGASIQADTGDIEALNIGIDFEQKAVIFYKDQFEEAEDEIEREFIEHMIAEEKGHHAALADMKMYLENPESWFQEKERTLLDGA